MAGRLAGKHILIVEDEYFIASDIRRALQQEDAIVVGPVGHVAKGLALLDGAPIDAAVLDVNLEGATSYPLADELTERAVPCLFVTGYDGWSMPEAYRHVPRIAKPFSMEQVIETLARLVVGRQ